MIMIGLEAGFFFLNKMLGFAFLALILISMSATGDAIEFFFAKIGNYFFYCQNLKKIDSIKILISKMSFL